MTSVYRDTAKSWRWSGFFLSIQETLRPIYWLYGIDHMKQTSNRNRLNNEQGFVLIASAVAAVVIFGMAGLAFYIGRMYITKKEAQKFADSASLYAAPKLDGTTAAPTRADNAVKNNPNAWNFATTAFDANKTIVEYSVDGSTNWAKSSSVTSPATVAYVRVTALVD